MVVSSCWILLLLVAKTTNALSMPAQQQTVVVPPEVPQFTPPAPPVPPPPPVQQQQQSLPPPTKYSKNPASYLYNPMGRRNGVGLGKTWWDGPYSPYVSTRTSSFLTYTDEAQVAMEESSLPRPKTYCDAWWEEKTVKETGVGMFETYTDRQRSAARAARTYTDAWWEEKTVKDTGVGMFETYTDRQRRQQ